MNAYQDYWESADPDHRKVLISGCRPWLDSCRHASQEWEDWILIPSLNLPIYPAIVEWGCGVGRILKACPIEATLVGIDMSKSMLSDAVSGRSAAVVYSAVYLHTDGQNCSIASNSIDLVYSILVLQHVPTRRMIDGIVREWARILKPGGFVRAQTLCAPPHPESEFGGSSGASFESQKEFAKVFRLAGFDVIEEQSGGLADSPLTTNPAAPGEWMWVTAVKSHGVDDKNS